MVQSIAILGTGSDVGKTLIASGICRILRNHGVKVAPFKAQNMSNNAQPALISNNDLVDSIRTSHSNSSNSSNSNEHTIIITNHNHGHNDMNQQNQHQQKSWGEIGTAQAMQAEACQILPRVEMNPILLKSGGRRESDGAYLCNVIVLGKSLVIEDYGQLGKRTNTLMDLVLKAHQRLIDLTSSQVIVIEGAGSCTELNLMERDVVNLPLVRKLHCPWILVANIDPGGVFAQIVGTKACVSDEDWDLCVGVIVNQLRGEVKYFEPGPQMIEEMVGKPVFVVPYLYNLNLPEEDGLGVERRLANEKQLDDNDNDDSGSSNKGSSCSKKKRIVVLSYPHIAITSDFTPLENDQRFSVEWRRYQIPKDTFPTISCVILPGSRLTRSDLEWMKNETKWVPYLENFVKLGGTLIGICGGYQMLGWSVKDTEGVEGSPGVSIGLKLLPIETDIEPAECKIVTPRQGLLHGTNIQVDGFELHCGRSVIRLKEGGETVNEPDQNALPMVLLTDLVESCNTSDEQYDGLRCGNVMGTYIHGLFNNRAIRSQLLLGSHNNDELANEQKNISEPLDVFANYLESCGLTFETIRAMIGKANDINSASSNENDHYDAE